MQQIKDGGGEQANRRKKLKTTNGGGELSRPAVGDERRVIYNGQETLMVCNFFVFSHFNTSSSSSIHTSTFFGRKTR